METDEIWAASQLGSVALGRDELETGAEKLRHGIEAETATADDENVATGFTRRHRRLVVEGEGVLCVDAREQPFRPRYVGAEPRGAVRRDVELGTANRRSPFGVRDLERHGCGPCGEVLDDDVERG